MDQIDVSFIPTQSIGFQALKLNVQSSQATIPPTAKYRVFSSAYGTIPAVIVSLAGTLSSPGTVKLSYAVTRVRPGSFVWVGTPSLRMNIMAYGL